MVVHHHQASLLWRRIARAVAIARSPLCESDRGRHESSLVVVHADQASTYPTLLEWGEDPITGPGWALAAGMAGGRTATLGRLEDCFVRRRGRSARRAQPGEAGEVRRLTASRMTFATGSGASMGMKNTAPGSFTRCACGHESRVRRSSSVRPPSPFSA